ncbi:MAG: nucleotidyltransferase domain-containing protein [Armatimonadota bacterium]|nr:nucleotidyltransferase domain-containing protein [Armatimonadota bacterium]MDR7412014.1 nucleotidyltransferase domain-containing protein [Armatimonadota bacterium]
MSVREKYRGRPPLPPDWRERLEGVADVGASHGVDLLYVFGSAARPGSGTPEDVDLAYLPGPAFRFEGFYADVSRRLQTDRVDLVDLSQASPFVSFEAVRTGRLLYRRRVGAENEFGLTGAIASCKRLVYKG